MPTISVQSTAEGAPGEVTPTDRPTVPIDEANSNSESIRLKPWRDRIRVPNRKTVRYTNENTATPRRKRLLDKIDSAEFHCLDRRIDGAVGCDNDSTDIGAIFAEPTEYLNAVHSRHFQIEKY